MAECKRNPHSRPTMAFDQDYLHEGVLNDLKGL